MAIKTVSIGTAKDIYRFDDGDTEYGIETTGKIKADTAPTANDEVVRYQDIPTPGNGVSAAANITDNALVRGDGGTKGIQEVSNITADDDGQITLAGDARFTNYIWIPSDAIKAPGAKPATAIAHGTLETPAWQFANQAVAGNQETVSFNMRIPDGMDRSVEPQLCAGWSSNGVSPGVCEWQFEYLYTAAGEDTTAAAQDTLTANDAAPATSNGLVISQTGDMDLVGASDICLHGRLTRLSAGATDTIAGTVELHGIAMFYAKNKFGEAI